jgi:hypothetical protein
MALATINLQPYRSSLAHAGPPRFSASATVTPARPLLNHYLCCHVRLQPSVAWECAHAACPTSDNGSARGRSSGPLVHLNLPRGTLSMSSPPLPLVQFPAPLVYCWNTGACRLGYTCKQQSLCWICCRKGIVADTRNNT